MNAKSVIFLAVVAVAVAALAWWLNQNSGVTGGDADAVALLPALSADLNAISKISVADAAGQTVTVTAQDDTWRVAEKAGYFADAGKVRALVLALANAKVLEEKTSNPEFYARLGVSDITEADSTAVLLNLTGPDGDPALLVGNSSPRAGGATLVRRAGDSTALLVSPAIDVATDVSEWLDTRVLDIVVEDVQSVVVQGGKDRRVAITKAAMFDKEFALAALAHGQTADTRKMNALGRNLAGLQFENVIRSVAFAIGDYSFINVTYTLFNGVIIDARVFYPRDTEKANKQYWFAATARFDQQTAQKFVPQPSGAADSDTEDGSGEDADDDAAAPTQTEPLQLTAADIEDRRQQAEDINARLKGWIYEIAESRYSNFNVTTADLVRENPPAEK